MNDEEYSVRIILFVSLSGKQSSKKRRNKKYAKKNEAWKDIDSVE